MAEAADDDETTAPALAEAVGLHRTTTWRILATLEQERLVRRDERTGAYRLGFGLIDLAGQASGAALARSAAPVLRRLAEEVGETAALAVLREGALTYVAESTSASVVVSAGLSGLPVPMHATSTGKALLAYSTSDDVRSLLGPGDLDLPRHTSTTITSRAALMEELAATRDRGYAVCRGEFETTAWGVSAPVSDAAGRPVAIVSIWGPGERLTDDRFPALGDLAVAAATEISGVRP